MKYLLIILVSFLSLNGQASSQFLEGLHTSNLSYWVVPDVTKLTWQQALKHAKWTEQKGEFNLGYAQKEVWLKQDIQSLSKGDWVMQIPYPLLDYLDLYLLKGKTLIKQIHTGDMRSFDQRLVKVPSFVLGLSASQPDRYQLLARIKTQGTMMMPIVWRTQPEFAEHLAQQQLIYGEIRLSFLFWIQWYKKTVKQS